MKFKNGDLVQTNDGSVSGRVVGYMNPTNASDDDYGFYVIEYHEDFPEFPWQTMVMPGTMLTKLTVADELARIEEETGENYSDLTGMSNEALEHLRDAAQQELDDRRDTWEDAVKAGI